MTLAVELVVAKSGRESVVIGANPAGSLAALPGANRLPLHSLYDPVREAERMVSRLPTEVTEFLVIGSGLMYLPLVLSTRPGVRVYVLELFEEITAVCGHRPEMIMARERGITVIDTGATAALKDVRAFPVILPNYLNLIKVYRPQYFDLLNSLAEELKSWQAHQEVIGDNQKNNVDLISRAPGINQIHNNNRNLPAIILGAGPTLPESLSVLRQYQSRVMIIATGTALRSALAVGVVPDLFCLSDPNQDTRYQIERITVLPPMIFTPGVHPDTLRNYSGVKIVCCIDHDRFREDQGTLARQKGTLPSGGTVTHTCLALAQVLTAGDIFLAGVDLTEGFISHCRDSYHYTRMLNHSNRFSLLDQQQPDSKLKYLSFKNNIERLIIRGRNRTYRVNPTAVSIQGCTPLTTAEFSDRCRALPTVDKAATIRFPA